LQYRFNEIFKNNYPGGNALDDCYFGVVATADCGAGMISTEINSLNELREVFGENTDYNAESFLKYSGNLKYLRVVNQSIANKRLNFADNSAPAVDEIEDFYNETVADLAEVVVGDNRISIIERYPRKDEDVSVTICSSESAWNQEITNEKLNLVISKSLNTPPESPLNNDMYIVAAGGADDWTGQSGKYAVWLTENSAWNFVSVLSNDVIYVADEKKEYRYVSPNWVAQDDYYNQFDHIKYKNESAYRVVYHESLQNSFGKIVRFNQLFFAKPDFVAGDFVVLVMKKQSGKFFLAEKYVVNYSNVGEINNKSAYIYIKTGSTNTNAINTHGLSIAETRFQHGTSTNLEPTSNDYEAAVGLIDDDPDVRIVADFEHAGTMNLVSGKLKSMSSKKILISGCTNPERYTDTNAVIDDFGLSRSNGYQNPTGYEKCAVFASMEPINGSYKPFFGAIAGLVVSNLRKRIFSSAGYDRGRLNSKKNLIRINNIDSISLSQERINPVQYDGDIGTNFITNDLMQYGNLSVGYSLLFDVIEEDIRGFFTDYNIKCPRLVENEKLRNLLINRIVAYGVECDVAYATINGVITYTVTLYYKNIVKEIIVNFTII
jgi:hypothetical protein